MDKYLFDACALIAFYTNEDGADIVHDIIEKAYQKKCLVSISQINLLEVFYDVYKSQGEKEAKDFLDDIACSPIKIIQPIDKFVFIEAGRLKASYRISLADSVFLAESLKNDYIGVTADHHELDIIEKKENANMLWIR